MSINNFIPTVWSGTLLEALNDAHVATNCVNREYEGEIQSFGDQVRINAFGRVTTYAYTKAADITAAQQLQDASMSLIIDQGRYYNFEIEDVDKAQIKPKIMTAAMKEAAYDLADVSDEFLILLMNNGVATAAPDNLMTTRALGTGAADEDAYETLVDMGVLLKESNAPKGDWFAMMPAWVHGLLLKDPRFVSFGTPENIARAKGGAVGQVAGFTIYESNNIYSALSSTYAIIAGSKSATTYAEQVTKTEAYRPPLRFADAVKGLHIYGAKVTRPNALVVIPVTVA